MKHLFTTVMMTMILVGAAQAQGGAAKKVDPGKPGAVENQSPDGVARDAGEVKAQQGRSSDASPGTTGAAPGADTKSSSPSPSGK